MSSKSAATSEESARRAADHARARHRRPPGRDPAPGHRSLHQRRGGLFGRADRAVRRRLPMPDAVTSRPPPRRCSPIASRRSTPRRRCTIRALAFDDLIEVAAPVLSQSERLDDEALIETARNKSQAHLMAISTRKVLSGAVTDVLVLRGNDEVVQSTVNNPGAEFSERGFTRLVDSRRGRRQSRDLPRHASDDSAASLSEADRQGLRHGAGAARGRQPAAWRATCRPRCGKRRGARARRPSAITQETAIAHALVKSLYEDGRLDEFQVAAFAEAGKFDEANAAIAALANVPVVDRREHDDGNPRRGRA